MSERDLTDLLTFAFGLFALIWMIVQWVCAVSTNNAIKNILLIQQIVHKKERDEYNSKLKDWQPKT